MILLFTTAFFIMLYCMISSGTYDSSTIFPLILFGFLDVLFILSFFKSGNFVQELSVGEEYIMFNYFNCGKNYTKVIKLDDIENFHTDIDIQWHGKFLTFYIDFSIKLKNSEEIQKFSSIENSYPKGMQILFDIQDKIPNFTYTIESNVLHYKNCWLYYAKNQKFNDADVKYESDRKKTIIILFILIAILIIIPIVFIYCN